MAETFIRPLKEDEEINHINGNKSDNSISNLEIISRNSNNKKYIDFIELGLTEKELLDIKTKCLENNITLKQYILQKLKE